MSLIACGSIHEGHEWLSDDSRGRRDFYLFGCSIMWAILPIRERCQDIDQVLIHEIIFVCLSVFSSSEVLAKIISIRSKLPTAACWSREKKRGNCEANLLYAESDFGTTDKSFTVFFAPEALNLIVVSNSYPVELDNSANELHVPSRRKKSILFCGFWFPCFNVIWYDPWCHVAWQLKFR